MALFDYISTNNIELVEKVLVEGADPNEKDTNGALPLILSLRNDYDNRCFNILLKYGANVNLTDDYNTTALMMAALTGNLIACQELLNRGADINAAEKYGDTALIMATINGHLDVVRLLLQNGAAVNAQNNRGATSLIYATQHNDYEIVKLLYSHNVNPNLKTSSGLEAIDLCTNDQMRELHIHK